MRDLSTQRREKKIRSVSKRAENEKREMKREMKISFGRRDLARPDGINRRPPLRTSRFAIVRVDLERGARKQNKWPREVSDKYFFSDS